MAKAKPIYLVLSKPFAELETGASRFWGNPDLPEGVPYPMYVDDEGDEFPYVFVCQLNLEQLAAAAPENPLPKKGLMSFFAKIDHNLGYMAATDGIQSHISDPEDVRVLYFPDTQGMRQVVLVDDEDNETAPQEMAVNFADSIAELGDDHALFAAPTHREWEDWDAPCRGWEILLQVDSFEDMDFSLNFIDCGVLDFLISPADLAAANFGNVRGIILST